MSTETENTTTTKTTTPETSSAAEAAANAQKALDAMEATNLQRIGDCIKSCDGYAKNCHQLCEFLAYYGGKLLGLNWDASHVYPKITIQIGGYDNTNFEQDARKIARRFPGTWRRVKDEYTCGVLNWNSEFGGMKMEIRHAEKIRWTPEPNTEVDPNGPAPAMVDEAQT